MSQRQFRVSLAPFIVGADCISLSFSVARRQNAAIAVLFGARFFRHCANDHMICAIREPPNLPIQTGDPIETSLASLLGYKDGSARPLVTLEVVRPVL